MKIVLFRGSTHEADGATRMLVQLANELSTRGHDITVLRWKYRESRTFFPLGACVDLEHVRSSGSKGAARHSRGKRGSSEVGAPLWKRVMASLRDPIGSVLLPTLERLSIGSRVPAAVALYYRLWRRHHREVIRQYRRKLAELAPDIVVIFFTRAHFFAAEAAKQLDIPVICSMHSDPRAYSRRLGSEFDYLMEALPAASVTVLDEAFRIVVPGSTTAQVAVIPNWVDTGRFHVNPGSSRDRLVISVGRLIEIKNHELLIDAWAMLARDFPDWSLDIFGSGPLEGQLLAQIERLRLRRSVHIRAPLNAIEKAFSKAAVHVMPSLREGFGLVLVEAMASGLPSVVLDGSGPPTRMVQESRAGLVCSPEPSDLAEAMQQLMDSEELRRSMGSRGVTYAERFADNAVISRWETHLQEVWTSHRGA